MPHAGDYDNYTLVVIMPHAGDYDNYTQVHYNAITSVTIPNFQ